MKRFFKLVFFAAMVITIPMTMSCEKPPLIVLDPDLTTSIVGSYSGNYVVNYDSHPEDNFSSQISLVVSKIDKKIIKVDAQGGDSFECSVSGTVKNLKLFNITNNKGAYANATELEGAFINGRLYFKVTGTSQGGPFSAEFTAI